MFSFATIFWKKFHVPSILFRINCHDVNLQFQSPKAYLLSQQVICILPFPSPIHYSSTPLPKYCNHYHLLVSIFSSSDSTEMLLLKTPRVLCSEKKGKNIHHFVLLYYGMNDWDTNVCFH